MNEAEAYGKYQDAKSDLDDAVRIMLKCGMEGLDFSETEIADDIREVIKEIDNSLYEEI